MLNAHTTSSSDYKGLWDNIIIHYYYHHHHNLTLESDCEPVWIKGSILYSCEWQFSVFFFRFRSSWLGGGNLSYVEQICSWWINSARKNFAVLCTKVVAVINEILITSCEWLRIYTVVAIWQISSCSVDLLAFLAVVHLWGSAFTAPFSTTFSYAHSFTDPLQNL